MREIREREDEDEDKQKENKKAFFEALNFWYSLILPLNNLAVTPTWINIITELKEKEN